MALTTLPTAALADDAVDNTKVDLAANYAFTGTVSGASDMVKLGTTNVTTDVSSVDFEVFDTTYPYYIIKIANARPDATGNTYGLAMRIKEGGSYQTGSNYEVSRNRVYQSYPSSWTHNGSGYTNNNPSLSMGTNSSGNGYSAFATHFNILIHNPTDDTGQFSKSIYCESWGGSDLGRTAVHHVSFTWSGNQNDWEGIRFRYGAGNVADGIFTIYGVKN